MSENNSNDAEMDLESSNSIKNVEEPADVVENPEIAPEDDNGEPMELPHQTEEEEAANNDSEIDCIILSDDESEQEDIGVEKVEENNEVECSAEDGVEKVEENNEIECSAEDGVGKVEENNEYEHVAEDEATELERGKVDEGFFADDLEMLELTLPQQTNIKEAALKLWNSRKVVVYPVPVEEIQKSMLAELLSNSNCSQIAFHIEREGSERENWTGSLDLVFDSKPKMNEFTEKLRALKCDIRILNAANVTEWNKEFDSSRSVHFSPNELKKWPQGLVCVKYLPRSISEDRLREIFPEAFDVMLYTSDRPNLTETQRFTGFLFYDCHEIAEKSVNTHIEKKTSIDGIRLAFFKYDRITHPHHVAPTLLTPSERYLILKERQVVEKLAKARGGHCATALEKFDSRIKDDDTIRKTYGLPVFTVDELRLKKNLRIIKDPEAFKIIKQKGLLWRNRDKLLTSNPKSLETAARPPNKGLRSGVTNPNKRKRKRLTKGSKSGQGMPQATVPPLFSVKNERGVRPPPHKFMRHNSRPQYVPREQGGLHKTRAMYRPEYTMPREQLPQQFQAGYTMPREEMPPQMAHRPQMMMPWSAPGMAHENRLTSRLLNMAHDGTSYMPGNVAGPLPFERTRPPNFGPGPGGPFRGMMPTGQQFPGPGMPIARGSTRGMPRPIGRGGWTMQR